MPHQQPMRLPSQPLEAAKRCRVDSLEGSASHAFWNFDTQQGHTVLDDLAYITGND